MNNNVITILIFLFSNICFAQKKDFLINIGTEYIIIDDNERNINLGLGVEKLINHDVSMALRLGYSLPTSSIYRQTIGTKIIENSESSSGFLIHLEPFNYNFTQDLRGLYMSLNASLHLNKVEYLSVEISNQNSEIISKYIDDDPLLVGGIRFGYKYWLAQKFGIDFSGGIQVGEDDPIIPISLKLLYNLK